MTTKELKAAKALADFKRQGGAVKRLPPGQAATTSATFRTHGRSAPTGRKTLTEKP